MKKRIAILVSSGCILIGVSLIAIMSCSRSVPKMAKFEEALEIVTPELLEHTARRGTNVSSRLVIKTSIINMVVKDIEDSIKSITQFTENKGGWVVSTEITKEKEIPQGKVTIRVPAEKFQETMEYLRKLAQKVTHEIIKGEDITEKYIDLQSQLRNLEAAETQLLKIMQRAQTTAEVLSVHKELTEIREKIEELKGRIHYLETAAAMATITINLVLSEELLPIPAVEKWHPVYVLKKAWGSVLNTLRIISYILIWIGTYAVIWVPLGIFVLQLRKFLKKRKST